MPSARTSNRKNASNSKNAIVFGAFAALGALAWSGCGPGSETRYYCDDLGCYTCDSYGCSDVKPTAPPKACTGKAACGPGEVCTSTGCLKTCADTADCGDKSGMVCKSGYCVAPATDPGKEVECTTKADCGDGKACVDAVCKACGGTDGPCPCAQASDCTGGLTCLAGRCTAPQNACKFSSDCDQGEVCADGQCLTSCEAAPCAEGFSCEKGVCKPGTVTGPTTPCTTDPECGAGKFCDQGSCVVDTRPKAPNCGSDTECPGTPPRKCVGGYCKYTCDSDQYCKTIDNRIGFCAKDGVCRTQQEALASCVDGSGCAPGQSCIDNQCK